MVFPLSCLFPKGVLILLLMHFAFCSGFRLASAKAAQHRLERGIWTSVRFGDMRRALAGLR